jgi:hypothetical protein
MKKRKKKKEKKKEGGTLVGLHSSELRLIDHLRNHEATAVNADK